MRLGYLLGVLTLAGLISGCSLTAPAPTDTVPTDTADAPHPHDTRGKHDERFADVLVDVHHHFQHHAAKADKSYTPRAAAQWTTASAACGKGLRIGIVDNLVDTTHPAFAGAKIVHRSFHLKGEQLARTSHGTAVTAIVAGSSQWHGLLPGAEIYHANVFHRGKKGKAVGSSKSIVQAIDWMIDQKVPIVNFSIGGGRNKLIEKAIAHASATGMILVASSGNRGPFSKKKSYPGAYDQVIAVTADDIRAYFRKYTKDRGEPGRDRYTGWGLVQLPPLCS